MSEKPSAIDFLGSGWAFPPSLDDRGRIRLVQDEKDIDEAIRIILTTRKGERPMRPEFGSDLHTLIFAPNDSGTAGLARRYVFEALARWEPRIEVRDVEVDLTSREEGVLGLTIRYSIPSVNSERNLVFPFYIIPGE